MESSLSSISNVHMHKERRGRRLQALPCADCRLLLVACTKLVKCYCAEQLIPFSSLLLCYVPCTILSSKTGTRPLHSTQAYMPFVLSINKPQILHSFSWLWSKTSMPHSKLDLWDVAWSE